ncbi:prolyl aminopeptidase [Parachitinimonas caeni]|uniref:Proline iminopeptidase n=1 Tax=Parachitinimonas caeni TaxID=3031301 RepID=A0ABT7DRD7_9NEIS|nr:prolyl aminopeptidase [Parachitinimonas caeni]MDK2122625.1 prolyl aminopeptidase [Parachitinimonas caeni]
MTVRSDLYPPLEPNHSGFLPLDDLHTMYWEESGNPDGVPVLFLHGGPGSGASPKHRQFFDPAFYRIVIFDQRGAGRSRPLGELRDNTTPLLIDDIERLREMLHVKQWLVFGGSWGSTLALAYSQTHPDRCLGLVLRGIFMCRPQEVDWFMYGMRQFFPEVWQKFADHLPQDQHSDLLTHYHAKINNPDPAIHEPAARAWGEYEGSCLSLLPDASTVASFASDPVALGLGRIEAHYFVNRIFLPDNSLLDNIDRIRHLPCVIVQGRYDVVCPPVTAWELHQAWPESELIMVDAAGHAAWEPGIQRELVAACERMKQQLA